MSPLNYPRISRQYELIESCTEILHLVPNCLRVFMDLGNQDIFTSHEF